MVRLRPQARGRAGRDNQLEVSSGAGADEVLRWCREVVARAGELEPAAEACSAYELRSRTGAFRERLRAGEPVGALLPEAFATVREAARRSIGLRHHDVQLIGGAVLHLGKIAEMRTGEGKTLTVTLPAYLASLTGQSVHVLTANDYLSSRDFAWMRPVYELLDLSVGLLRPAPHPNPADRRSAYAVDVTYGASQEFCYDFLRDNLAWEKSERTQRGLDLAIVDEADLVLLDEMRLTPLISGPAAEPQIPHQQVAAIAARLQLGVDYEVTQQLIKLTDRGIDRVEDWFGATNLYNEENAGLVQQLEQALAARERYRRDRDYAIIGSDVVVIDTNSGRPEPGRRFTAGLHEAIEAKEGLPVRPATQILAVVSVRDYLDQYSGLVGLTGTAASDAQAYRQIYGLEVVAVPTNRPMIRVDHPDLLYSTRQTKLTALASDAARRQGAGQPVLIGTRSVDDADAISGLLGGFGVDHEVLAARNHEREAEILAGAGSPGAVTIAVKMAGRGVDVVLGGADGSQREEVADAGGLCVLGAERATIGRMDMHLRGRAGRQGDPGESRFYASFDDELLKGVAPKFGRSGFKDGVHSRPVSFSIDRAQTKAAEYQTAWLLQAIALDEVLAGQQRLVYADRRTVLEQPSLRIKFLQMLDGLVDSGAMPATAISAYERRANELGVAAMREVERRVLLSVTDSTWREHLAAMADLLTGVSIRAAGRPIPLPEYRREAALLFDEMIATIRLRAVSTLLTLKVDVD